MANTDIISYKIKDMDGETKSVPYFIPSGGTIAAAQGLVNVTAPLLDLAIDGKIMEVSMTIKLAVPGGLKGAPIVGNTVHEGALIDYSAVGTIYAWGTFFPSWKNTGFSGNTVDNSGAFANVITDLGQFTDKFDNALDVYLKGQRRFRK